MTKPRAEYAYYATRLRSLSGATRFKITAPGHDRWGHRRRYTFYVDAEELFGRYALIKPGSAIYRECMKAVDRLIAEEAAE